MAVEYPVLRLYLLGFKNRFVFLKFLLLPSFSDANCCRFKQNLEDLGLPENGIDGIFLQSTGVNGSMGDC